MNWAGCWGTKTLCTRLHLGSTPSRSTRSRRLTEPGHLATNEKTGGSNPSESAGPVPKAEFPVRIWAGPCRAYSVAEDGSHKAAQGGSTPSRTMKAGVAQWRERGSYKAQVGGLIPSAGTRSSGGSMVDAQGSEPCGRADGRAGSSPASSTTLRWWNRQTRRFEMPVPKRRASSTLALSTSVWPGGEIGRHTGLRSLSESSREGSTPSRAKSANQERERRP